MGTNLRKVTTHMNIDRIVEEVSSWNGVSASPHRFGGVEFDLGQREIGHVHRSGMVDIPFNTAIRNVLIEEGKAGPHHILAESGWITFYVRDDADVQNALWLFRLAYLFHVIRGRGRTAGLVDMGSELHDLNLSDSLRAVVDGMMAKH